MLTIQQIAVQEKSEAWDVACVPGRQLHDSPGTWRDKRENSSSETNRRTETQGKTVLLVEEALLTKSKRCTLQFLGELMNWLLGCTVLAW